MNHLSHIPQNRADRGISAEAAATFAASLFGAANMATLATLLTEYTKRELGCDEAVLVWWLDGRQDPNLYIAGTLDAEQDILVDAAVHEPQQIVRSADGGQFALSLSGNDSQVGAV